jgi:hypothetical protein
VKFRPEVRAGRRFGKELTKWHLIAALLDVRTKALCHFSSAAEKRKAKGALKVAYIAWGKQAHSFSDALLQAHDKQRIAIKVEAGVSGGAAEPEQQPAKKQKQVADYLDWDEEAGEGDVYMSLEDQLEAEFAGVWSVWMGDIQVPWASLFPLGPSSVRQDDAMSSEDLEDGLAHTRYASCVQVALGGKAGNDIS